MHRKAHANLYPQCDVDHSYPVWSREHQNFSGVVQESHNIGLGFKPQDKLKNIRKEGDYVKKGQLIAQLDHTDYQLGVQALEIQCKQLEDEVKRTEALYRSKSISINDYEKHKPDCSS